MTKIKAPIPNNATPMPIQTYMKISAVSIHSLYQNVGRRVNRHNIEYFTFAYYGEGRTLGERTCEEGRNSSHHSAILGNRKEVSGERRSADSCPSPQREREDSLAERVRVEISKRLNEISSDVSKQVKELVETMSSFAKNSKLRLDAVDGTLQSHGTRLGVAKI